MSKVFRITPKRIKRSNGTVLTPEMAVTVTTAIHTSNPFSNGQRKSKRPICASTASTTRKLAAIRTTLNLLNLIKNYVG